jgi:hypothetical protein
LLIELIPDSERRCRARRSPWCSADELVEPCRFYGAWLRALNAACLCLHYPPRQHRFRFHYSRTSGSHPPNTSLKSV